MAERSTRPDSPAPQQKNPAQQRLEYLRRLTVLLTVIAAALALLFILLPSGNVNDADPDSGVSDPSSTQTGGSPSGGDGLADSGNSGSDAGRTGGSELPDFEPEYEFAPSDTAVTGARPGSSTDPGDAAAMRDRPMLIIVIDDVGYNTEGLKPFLEIPVPITFAVLPQLEYSKESAELIESAGQEIIMHLPMESRSGQYPGPGTLTEEMSVEQLLAELNRNIETVPGLVGINNHMGSKGTEDIRIVREVLQFARDRELLFLDSRTTDKSVVPLMANAIEIPYIERDVFLDNQKERAYILEALRQGKEIAGQQGYAVLIGHVWTEELAEVLLENYEFILDEGYDFATLSSVIMKGR
jgi:polysaccharide deacetylase 2 family uncharacterized protein YibQ